MIDPKRACARSAGMTLLEMLVAIVLFLFVLVAVYDMLDGSQRLVAHQVEIADMDASARLALDVITTQLRELGRNPARLHPSVLQPPDLPFVSVHSDVAMGSSIEIRADLDGNGDTLGASEHVRFEWRDPPIEGRSDLIRLSDSDGDGDLDREDILASNVKRLVVAGAPVDIFTYLDVSGAALAVRADVPTRSRAVRVRFAVETAMEDRVSHVRREIGLDQTISLRNLRTFPR